METPGPCPTYEQSHRKVLQNYKKSFRHYLLTSRFNTQTWSENERYREHHPGIGCLYCCPDGISQSIPIDSVLFVLEMDNDQNKILGVGMVRNRASNKKHYVYTNGNYNRYVYTGAKRIHRADMTEEEDTIMRVFDILCFTGNRHMKRGQGLKSFPVDILYKCSVKIDLVGFIRDMFKRRIAEDRIAEDRIAEDRITEDRIEDEIKTSEDAMA